MSALLPLLLAGALATSSLTPAAGNESPASRPRRVRVDTAVHRQLAADLAARARTAAESGLLDAARAQLLVANTMLRESGGLEESSTYSLVHIDYALERYSEAGDLLNELADQALRNGNPTLAATAVADAAELYGLGARRVQLATAVSRLRVLITDPRIAEADRAVLKKRLG